MKTAEEWVKNDPFQYCDTPSDESFVKIIKQIQLDAWKQGMSDAITQARQQPDCGDYYHNYCGCMDNELVVELEKRIFNKTI